MSIKNHRLLIKNPEISLGFYQNILGMTLIHQFESDGSVHYFLSFSESQQAALELIYNPSILFFAAPQPSLSEGYWKFSVAVKNLDTARTKLLNNGIMVSDCFEIPSLAYLCHLTDPDGYAIELIQTHLRENTKPISQVDNNPLSCIPIFNLSTLRVKNINNSLPFYRSLGMELVYTYRSDIRGMNLYFLVDKEGDAFKRLTKEPNIEEQLWQYPTTVLELQQIDDTDKQPNFSYHTSSQTGFLGLDIHNTERTTYKPENEVKHFRVGSAMVSGSILSDPDGYQIRYYSVQTKFT